MIGRNSSSLSKKKIREILSARIIIITIIIIRRKKYELTVEPALFHTETGSEERVLRLGRKMIEKGGQTGDQKGATPRVAGVHS